MDLLHSTPSPLSGQLKVAANLESRTFYQGADKVAGLIGNSVVSQFETETEV
jgi:hypothetical protein